MDKKKIIIIAVLVAAIAAFFAFDLGQYLSFESLKERQADLQSYYQSNKLLMIVGFFLLYVAVAGASLPGAAILTLAAGAIFGFGTGLLLVSFASSIGATLAFIAARYLFSDSIRSKFGQRLKTIDRGIEKDGPFYLFALRLVPAFPFFVVNLIMALTKLPARTFYWVSQLGMLPGTAVYVNAGTQLATIDSASGILSPAVLGSFALLGIFPFIAKKIVAVIKARQVYKGWDKPKKFDDNIVVIGAGSGGLVTSLVGATVNAKVTLIEKHKMGGDCLNTGCVPSKALIKSAKTVHTASRATELGLKKMEVEFEFSEVMDRIHRVIKEVEPHDSVERYEGFGVNCVSGDATITSPWTVEVNGKTITTQNIVIATGARPFVPPIAGLDQVDYLTSDTLWELREQPKRLVVLGGGPIGSEITQSFQRLGTQVVQVERASRIMGREDPEISEMVMKRFRQEGVDLRVNHSAEAVRMDGDQAVLVCDHNGEKVDIPFDRILVAVGREARVTGFGMEKLNIPLTEKRTVEVNEFLQTKYPNIYAVGDVAGPYQFTHTAAHQAWYAGVNALFGHLKKFKADYSVIPWCTFTDPEVARVGLNETEAKEQGIEYEVTRFDIAELDRAIADEEAHGVVKILTKPGKDKILGVTFVGDHAGDLIAEFVLAMKTGAGLNKIIGTIHTYPTLAESNKYAAGEWKKAHKPEKVLEYLKRYFAWSRG